MPRYTNDSRERVRDAVDFVELVSARTELRRAGPRSYQGLCPFHDERTPSFGIDPVQKVYYCFGCQASGDPFTFVQETEGVDFKGALELLADHSGVELEVEREDPREAEQRRRRERLLELLERTCAYYERYLWESEEAEQARRYLHERGLGEEMLREFRVGYSPSAWDRVLLASRRGGFSEHELYATGLAQRSQQNGQPYDRFRGRIVFPLADMRGRVLGFGARAMRDGQKPKYLNTSDNELYHKGEHLYGAHLARAHASKEGVAVLCEGYTDVIALHQAGFRNAVGLMGTALTDRQVGELSRLAHTVLLALDADSAGQEAMLKAYRLAERRKLELRVVGLPQGADPAELVQSGGREAVERAVSGSLPFVRFRVERVLASGDDTTPEGRDRMIEELRPIFETLPASAMRMELTRLVSGRLGLPETLSERLLAQGGGTPPKAHTPPQRHAPAGEAPEAPPRVLSAREQAERAFLAQCIAAPQAGEQALTECDPSELFTGELLQQAAGHLREHGLQEPLRGLGEERRELVALLAELVVEAGRWGAAGDGEHEGTQDGTHTSTDEGARGPTPGGQPATLEVQRLQLQLASVERRIHAARAQGTGEVSELARLRAQLKQRFDSAQERALAETGE